MSEWEQKFQRFNSLCEIISQIKEENTGDLRFNRSTIRASDVAGQYYCEKKIEMAYMYGEVETETKNQGTAGHETLLEGCEVVDQENIWKSIFEQDEILILEWFLLGKYNDIILAGQPDAVLFENSEPVVIFEYKFSKRKQAYPSHHVQAGFYGLLLKSLGFDTRNLFYAIVVANREARDDPELRHCVLLEVMRNGLMKATIPIKNAVIYLNKFNEKEAAASLDWAIKFWKSERDAISTSNRNKCWVCEYRQECKKVLF